MNSAEIRNWVKNRILMGELKEEFRKLIENFGASRVAVAASVVGNDCPEKIRQFIYNRGECLEG